MRKCSRWGTPLRLLAAAHPSWNGDGKQGLRLCELIVDLEQKIPNRRRRRLLQSPASGPQNVRPRQRCAQLELSRSRRETLACDCSVGATYVPSSAHWQR